MTTDIITTIETWDQGERHSYIVLMTPTRFVLGTRSNAGFSEFAHIKRDHSLPLHEDIKDAIDDFREYFRNWNRDTSRMVIAGHSKRKQK